MSTQEPGRVQPGLTPLPRLEDLPSASDGFDRAKVQEAFDAFLEDPENADLHPLRRDGTRNYLWWTYERLEDLRPLFSDTI